MYCCTECQTKLTSDQIGMLYLDSQGFIIDDTHSKFRFLYWMFSPTAENYCKVCFHREFEYVKPKQKIKCQR